MGYSITWFAVPETHADSFFERLGLTTTGETEELPESLISSANMDTGWRVLWYNKYDCPFLNEKALAQLSVHHEIIACTIEEHCMVSTAALWNEGKRKWLIRHDGSDGPKGLDIQGTPPDHLASTRIDFEQRQIEAGGIKADVDYISEIPLVVAEHIVGFKHDADSSHMIGGMFHVLTRKPNPEEQTQSKPSLIKRLFGR